MIRKININLRERLNEGGILLVPGAPNALAARIIQDVGFEVIYLTGAGIANSYLGVPDLGLLTLTELASHVAATRDVVDLPLIVDADTGFGNAINIQRTVKVLERSGANAIQIEDQIFPKRCGHFKEKRVTSGEAMVQKIKAAVDARIDEDLLIIARTDARAILGFEEALERGAMYFEAGADVTFIEAPRSIDEIKAIPRRLEGPQLVNMVAGGSTPLMPLDELEEAGYAMVIYANAALQSAIRGMKSVLTYLHREGSLTGVFDQIETFGERQRLVGKELFDAAEKLYAISGERRG